MMPDLHRSQPHKPCGRVSDNELRDSGVRCSSMGHQLPHLPLLFEKLHPKVSIGHPLRQLILKGYKGSAQRDNPQRWAEDSIGPLFWRASAFDQEPTFAIWSIQTTRTKKNPPKRVCLRRPAIRRKRLPSASCAVLQIRAGQGQQASARRSAAIGASRKVKLNKSACGSICPGQREPAGFQILTRAFISIEKSLAMFETTPLNQLLPNPSTNSESPITPIQGVLL